MERDEFERRLDKMVNRTIDDIYIEDGNFGMVLDDGTHIELSTDQDGELLCRVIDADEQ